MHLIFFYASRRSILPSRENIKQLKTWSSFIFCVFCRPLLSTWRCYGYESGFSIEFGSGSCFPKWCGSGSASWVVKSQIRIRIFKSWAVDAQNGATEGRGRSRKKEWRIKIKPRRVCRPVLADRNIRIWIRVKREKSDPDTHQVERGIRILLFPDPDTQLCRSTLPTQLRDDFKNLQST